MLSSICQSFKAARLATLDAFRHDKLRDTELLLWGDRQRRGLVQRFVRFFARQVSFLLASVLRLELTDLALGTKLDIPRPAQADDNDAGLR